MTGTIIKQLSEYPFALDDRVVLSTFYIDIGEQSPALGLNLSEEERHVLREVRWMLLDEIRERDRAFLWASGLASVKEYYDELTNWSDEISYPGPL